MQEADLKRLWARVLHEFPREFIPRRSCMADRINKPDWNDEDTYWNENYPTRPYAGSKDYTYYQPGYRYGYEAANKYQGREWSDVETDLQRDWDRFEHRGQSTWEHMKAAVRDAWDRVTGRRSVGAR